MSAWWRENEKDVFCKVITFIVNPLLGFFCSLRRLNTKSSFYIIALFSLTFGIAFSTPGRRTDSFMLDAADYRADFENYTNRGTQYFLWQLESYVAFSGKSDFYGDTVNFLVSRVTDNYHILFFVLAFVFTFFSLKSLKLFVQEDNFKSSLSCFILLYLFLSNQIFNIDMYRFYTALAVAVYSILSYFVKRDCKYLLCLILAAFMHGTFFILVPLSLIYIFFGRYVRFWSVCVVVCFFISSISIELFNSFIPFLPTSLADKYDGYLSAMYVYKINEAGNENMMLKRLLELCCRTYINIMVLVMSSNYAHCIKGTKCEKMFRFLLVIMSFVNFTMMIPSLGSRFLMLALPFIAYVWLVCFSEKKFRKYVYILGAMFLLLIPMPMQIMQFPCLMYYQKVLEPEFYLTSPFYLFFKYTIFF